VVTVAEGSWASIESTDPSKCKFIEYSSLRAEQRKRLNVWVAKMAALAASVPLTLAVSTAGNCDCGGFIYQCIKYIT